ncbi:MAG: methyltransferase domain-containing protein [Candidatus Margulisiibacteriota bacterium]|jgi:SAM-dependent methyltransferase
MVRFLKIVSHKIDEFKKNCPREKKCHYFAAIAKKHFIEIIAALYIILLACINPFTSLYLFFRNVPYYIKNPLLLDLDFFYFYYYHVFYNFACYIQEKNKTGIKDIGELTYGETPYFSLAKVFKSIPIKKTDIFYDLGCGRGKLVFFVRKNYGIPSFGVDIIPTFIKVANKFAQIKKLKNIAFFEDDLKVFDFSKGTIFFMAWTCLNITTSKKITENLAKIPKTSFVITTSAPLNHPDFTITKKFKVLFTWGKGHIYINQKK